MEYTITTEITFFFFMGGLVSTSIYMTKLSMVHHKEKLDQNMSYMRGKNKMEKCKSYPPIYSFD
jgi:hypothetical protein